MRCSWTEQFDQIVGTTLEKSSALQGQSMVQEENAAEFDQAPDPFLGVIVGYENEGVVCHAELEGAGQCGIRCRYGVELLLGDAEGVCTAL